MITKKIFNNIDLPNYIDNLFDYYENEELSICKVKIHPSCLPKFKINNDLEGIRYNLCMIKYLFIY